METLHKNLNENSFQHLTSTVAEYRAEVERLSVQKTELGLDIEQATKALAEGQCQLAGLMGEHARIGEQLRMKLAQLDPLLLEVHLRNEIALHEQRARKEKALTELRTQSACISQGDHEVATIDDLAWVDHRAAVRVPLAVEMTLSSENNFFMGFSENISAGGIFVATYHPRPVGENLLVEFSLPGEPGTIACLAEVTWVKEYRPEVENDKDSPPGMGLRFVSLEEIDAARIAQFVKKRQPLFFPEADDQQPRDVAA